MSYVIQHISKMDYLEVYDNGDDKMSVRWESNVDCATHFRTRSEAESVMADTLAICTVITVHAARNSKEYKQQMGDRKQEELFRRQEAIFHDFQVAWEKSTDPCRPTWTDYLDSWPNYLSGQSGLSR